MHTVLVTVTTIMMVLAVWVIRAHSVSFASTFQLMELLTKAKLKKGERGHVLHVLVNRDRCFERSKLVLEIIVPPPHFSTPIILIQLEGRRLDSQSLRFVGSRVTWYRPTNLQQLLDIKRAHPDCKIVIGNTELGLSQCV